jgi:hypothetical protein
VGIDNRLTLRNRQRVKHASWSAAISAQGLEEWRPVALCYAREDTQVQFQGTFPRMEYATEMMAQSAGHVFDGDLCHQIEVDFGA